MFHTHLNLFKFEEFLNEHFIYDLSVSNIYFHDKYISVLYGFIDNITFYTSIKFSYYFQNSHKNTEISSKRWSIFIIIYLKMQSRYKKKDRFKHVNT